MQNKSFQNKVPRRDFTKKEPKPRPEPVVQALPESALTRDLTKFEKSAINYILGLGLDEEHTREDYEKGMRLMNVGKGGALGHKAINAYKEHLALTKERAEGREPSFFSR